MATIVLQVTGMKCGGCENSVQQAVKECAGVSAVNASHKTGTVEIEYDETQADIEAIRKTIKDKGYAVA
jgi:copper chaperone